ncbi:MAG: hypothetical protein LBL74_05685 [Bacteroidales bacterium]|jgi:O-antigen ligase|nr:hypothetical protein [Bacteroidales bacterium]
MILLQHQLQGKNYLNAHNQFLQTGIAIGIFGMLVLIWVYLILVIRFLNRKQWWLISILIISTISMMFEAMLERQQGIFYFVFMISLMYASIKKISNKV